MYNTNSSFQQKEAIYIDGKDKTSDIQSYSFVGDKCIVAFKSNNKKYTYNKDKVQVIKSFDYQNADAIGILAQDNKHDNYFRAGLLINDKDLSGKPGHNINRINLLTENGNASLVMKDNNEIPRIILKVDSLGNPSIEMLDDKGKVKWKQ